MKTAIIGVGRMGRRHLSVLERMGLPIGSVSDRSEEALRTTAEEFSLREEQIYNDAEAMITATQPELVIIATTAPAHHALTLMAARQGAQKILCEKPMAISLAQCDEMVAVCEEHGTALAINHYMRFIPLGQRLRTLLASEDFGGLESMLVSGGNFGLAMVGTHFLELFQFLAEQPLAEVSAWLDEDDLPNPRGPQFFDRAGSIRALTQDRKPFYIHTGLKQGHTAKVVLAGRYGQLVVDPYVGTLSASTREPENRDLPTTRYVTPSVEQDEVISPVDTIAGTQAVLDALLADGPYPHGAEVRNVMAALVAAYVSDEAGHQPVSIMEDRLPLQREFPWA